MDKPHSRHFITVPIQIAYNNYKTPCSSEELNRFNFSRDDYKDISEMLRNIEWKDVSDLNKLTNEFVNVIIKQLIRA